MAYQPAYNPYFYQPTFMKTAPIQPPTVPTQQNTAIQNGFSCRPVTSKEEATAVQVDFFGPGTIMPDLAHGVIYLKRFNSQTGACDIFEFFSKQEKEAEPVQFATKNELDSLRNEIEKLKERMVIANDAD